MLPLNNKIMNIYSKNDSNLQESGHFDKSKYDSNKYKNIIKENHAFSKIINKVKIDLFVRIHTKAPSPGYNTDKGIETYMLGIHKAKDSIELARGEKSVILVRWER